MTLKDNIRKILKEEINNQKPKDLSPIIERLLDGLKYRNEGIICDIKVTVPFNRKTIEPDKSFKHYKIEITFLGSPKRIHEDIMDEAWTKAYDYLEQPTDLYSKYVDECGDSLNEQVESNDPDYSPETLNAIKRFVEMLELPLVKNFDVEWSEEQGLYRIKLYYLSRGNIKDINVLQDNDNKLTSTVRTFLGLGPYTIAVQNYTIDEKSDDNDVISESDDTEYAVIEITKPLGYMDLKYYYQAVPYWKTKEDKIYIKKGASGYKTISTKNIKVLKIFKNENDPEMKEYLKELRK
jgi:hypothetical protein